MNERQTNEDPMNEKPVPMDCATFEKISDYLYRPEDAEAALCEAALTHAESCSRCAALLTEVEWLEFSILDLARHDANRLPSPGVESTLLQEFRRQKAVVARRQIRWQLAALGVAAVLFLALGLSLRKHATIPAAPSTPGLDVATSHPQPAGSLASAPVNVAKAPEPLASKQSAQSDPSDSGDESAFVKLPYADESAGLDGGAIIRVVLSRSALASFGLPVADMVGTDPIQADLVVAPDGTPEAIRFVSQLNSSQEF